MSDYREYLEQSARDGAFTGLQLLQQSAKKMVRDHNGFDHYLAMHLARTVYDQHEAFDGEPTSTTYMVRLMLAEHDRRKS